MANNNIKATTAAKLAAQVSDACQWTLVDGSSFEEALDAASYSTIHEARGMADSSTRYDFLDGSSIITWASGWDFGAKEAPKDGLGCFCGEGGGCVCGKAT